MMIKLLKLIHFHNKKKNAYFFSLFSLKKLAVLTLFLGAYGNAFAQKLPPSASQITPPTFAPPPQLDEGNIPEPKQSSKSVKQPRQQFETPKSIFLQSVTVENGLPELKTKTDEIIQSIIQQTVDSEKIFAAARAIEAAYARAGYILVRVVVPRQSFENSVNLKILVVNGFFEKVDVSQVPQSIQHRVLYLLKPLVDKKSINLSEIERQLLLAGDTVGSTLRSILSAGTVTGASILTIESKYRPISLTVSADNSLSKSLGRWNLGLGLNFNSLLKLGEQIYLRVGGYPNSGHNGYFSGAPRNKALAAGFTVPIGRQGLTFNLEGADVSATPVALSNGLVLGSKFQRVSARLRYPNLRRRALTLNSELAFDAQSERTFLVEPFSIGLSKDTLRIFRFSEDGFWQVPHAGLISGRATASLGINGLGAKNYDASNGVFPSRQGSKPNFKKLEVSLAYFQNILSHLAGSVQARGQTAFNQPMSSSEQIGLIGQTGLSAFDVGEIQGDAGYVFRGELSSPWQIRDLLNVLAVSPYVFGAYGSVYKMQPTVLERSVVRGGAYGFGLRIAGFKNKNLQNANLSLEFGRQYRNDNIEKKNRFGLFANIVY